MKRIIFHIDQNCYFASVEMISRPELKDVPMAVAGDAKVRHGIILAKNEPAKQNVLILCSLMLITRNTNFIPRSSARCIRNIRTGSSPSALMNAGST